MSYCFLQNFQNIQVMKVSLFFLKSNASGISLEAYCISKIVGLKLILKHIC